MATVDIECVALKLTIAEAKALDALLGNCSVNDHLKLGLDDKQSDLISGIYEALFDAMDSDE